jgi:hypothetical protein
MQGLSTKVAAGSNAAAVVLVLVWIAGMLGLEVPTEVAGALVLLGGTLAGWLMPELAKLAPPKGRYEA